MNEVFDIRSDTEGCDRVNYGVRCFFGTCICCNEDFAIFISS
jgi:hypothetical protein